MNATKRMLAIGCFGLLALSLAAQAGPPKLTGGASTEDETPQKVARPAAKKAKLGEKAPDFTLQGTDGKTYKLSDFKGKIIVLEWSNPRCPIWVRCYETRTMQNARRAVKKLDKNVVWLSINSTHDTTAKENNEWIEEYELKHPFLLDTDGAVGRMYDARTTPHMYVIDEEQILRFHGALDDDRSGARTKKGEKVFNYVLNAVRLLKQGETVEPDYQRPYGCSVKYQKRK